MERARSSDAVETLSEPSTVTWAEDIGVKVADFSRCEDIAVGEPRFNKERVFSFKL